MIKLIIHTKIKTSEIKKKKKPFDYNNKLILENSISKQL